MESTLTARDKKLLYMLGFIVIAFVFGWLLMRPIIKSINKTNESLAEAQALKQQNENKVMGLGAAQTSVKRFEENLATATEEYYKPMDSSEIDKMFTTYVLGFGLRAKDLLITMPMEPTDEAPYRYSEAYKNYQPKDSSSSSSSSTSEMEADLMDMTGSGSSSAGDLASMSVEEVAAFSSYVQSPLEIYSDKQMMTKYTTSAGIYNADVTIVLTGRQDSAQKLLDDILTKPSIRVTGFSWDDMAPVVRTLEDGTIQVTESREKQLTIRLKLYMYDETKAGIEAVSKKD